MNSLLRAYDDDEGELYPLTRLPYLQVSVSTIDLRGGERRLGCGRRSGPMVYILGHLLSQSLISKDL